MNISIADVAPSRTMTASAYAVGATSRRTVNAIAAIAIDSGSIGAIPQASRSAQATPKIGLKIRISPAMGRSTIRLQWMLKPAGGFSRYCVRSYQPCPASSPRTCISRMLSSVSPSASQ